MTRVAAAMFGIASALVPPEAWACSFPGGRPALDERVDATEEIFVGRVLSGTERGVEVELGESPAAYIESRLAVVETLKGDDADERVVNHAVADMCDLGLIPGWTYVVFVDRDNVQVVEGGSLQWTEDSVPLDVDEEQEVEDPKLAEIRDLIKQSNTKADP